MSFECFLVTIEQLNDEGMPTVIRMWLQILAIITIVLSLVRALRSLFNQLRAVFRV